jgi:hypothetical protein
MRRRTSRSEKHGQRVALTLALYGQEPRDVYANLLWLQEQKGFKNGWVAHSFRELFGGWPRPRVMPEPVRPTDNVLEQWIALRPKRKGA